MQQEEFKNKTNPSGDHSFKDFVPSWNSLERFRDIIGVKGLYLTFIVPFVIQNVSLSGDSQNLSSKDVPIIAAFVIFFVSDRAFSAYRPVNLLPISRRSLKDLRGFAEDLDSILQANLKIDDKYKEFIERIYGEALSDQDSKDSKEVLERLNRFRLKSDPMNIIADYYDRISLEAQRKMNSDLPWHRLAILSGYAVSAIIAINEITSAIDQIYLALLG